MNTRTTVVLILVMVLFALALVKIAAAKRPVAADVSVIASVDGYEILKDEFEEGFAASVFAARGDRAQARREYLDTLIDQKLILLDAQKRNVDKTPDFLRSVERFWTQSLLTAAMEQKATELRRGVNVCDEDVRRIYEGMVKDGVTAKPLSEVYPQIKWQAERRQGAELLGKWARSLRKGAAVRIDNNALKGFK